MDTRVRLNVGGEVFETSLSTLERAGRDSVLGALLDPAWRAQDTLDRDRDTHTPFRTPVPAHTPPLLSISPPMPYASQGHSLFLPSGDPMAYQPAGARHWTSAPCSPMLKPSAALLGATSSEPPAGHSCSSPNLTQGLQDLSLKAPLGPLHESPVHRKHLSVDSCLVCLSCRFPTSCTCQRTASPMQPQEAPPQGDGGPHLSEDTSSVSQQAMAAPADWQPIVELQSSHGGAAGLDGPCARAPCTHLSITTSLGASGSEAPPSHAHLSNTTPLRQWSSLTNTNMHETQPAHRLHTPQCSPMVGPTSHSASPSQRGVGRPPRPAPVPEIFLDRDPAVFRVLLNLLRSGNLDLSSGVSVQSVICDADYLGLLDCVKGALLPPSLDANEMEKVHTLSPNVGPTELCTAMCGNADGSLTVAHGARITAYDWSLERVVTFFSELPQVDTIAHLSETHIVAGTSKGMEALPVYDLRASSLRNSKVGTITCLGASHPCYRATAVSDRFLFVGSLRKTLGAEWGVRKAVGVVDKETLQPVGEPGHVPLTTRRLSGPDRLQWIESRGLLLVAKRYSVWPGGVNEGASYVRLWDPRSGQVVWDWREYEEPQSPNIPADRWYALCDAVVCEDLSLLFKASPTAADANSRLSAIDLRCLSSSPLSGTAATVFPAATTFASGPVLPVLPPSPPLVPSPVSPRATTLSASSSGEWPVFSGHETWSNLQWQSSEGLGLRIGAQTREARFENNVLRLAAVPGTCQVICNRQPTLEVWSPVAQLTSSTSGDGKVSGPSEQGPLDPFMFRRSYADSREEYNRKRMNYSSMSSWVYDMALAGDHRLFVVREDNRQGNVDYGSIEVWETRQTGRPRHLRTL